MSTTDYHDDETGSLSEIEWTSSEEEWGNRPAQMSGYTLFVRNSWFELMRRVMEIKTMDEFLELQKRVKGTMVANSLLNRVTTSGTDGGGGGRHQECPV